MSFMLRWKPSVNEEAMPIIQGNIREGSVIHTDRRMGYDWLVVNGYDDD